MGVQHDDIDHTGITGVGGALTVEDEGTPLATGATTLDFVGAGVTASGTGAEKTITIPGGAGARVGAKVYKTAQTGTDPFLAFDNEVWDSDGFHDNVTDNTKLIVPTGLDGVYLAQASTFVSSTTRLEVYVNGSIARGRGTQGAGSANYAACLAVLDLAAGDYVQIKGNSGTSVTYGDAGSVGDHAVFSLTRLGV